MAATRPPLAVFRSVVKALFLREMKTRFGANRLGYLWAVLEPLAHVAVLSVIFGFSMRKALPGVDFPVFIATGILPWLLFTNIVTKSISAFDANRGLFAYRQVTPFAALAARTLVEGYVYAMVFLILLALGWFLGYDVSVADPAGVLLAAIQLVLMAFGVGSLLAVAGSFSENVSKVTGLVFRPLYFVSAIFFSVEAVPERFREWLLYNPLVHFMEGFRSAWFESFDSRFYDPSYLLAWTVAPLFLGLWVYRAEKEKVIAS